MSYTLWTLLETCRHRSVGYVIYQRQPCWVHCIGGQNVVRNGLESKVANEQDSRLHCSENLWCTQRNSHIVLLKVGLYFYLLAGLSWILSEADLEPNIWGMWFVKKTLPGETSEELWEAEWEREGAKEGSSLWWSRSSPGLTRTGRALQCLLIPQNFSHRKPRVRGVFNSCHLHTTSHWVLVTLWRWRQQQSRRVLWISLPAPGSP